MFDQMLTLKEVSEITRVPYSTIREIVKSGKLPGKKIGKQWRVKSGNLEKYLGK